MIGVVALAVRQAAERDGSSLIFAAGAWCSAAVSIPVLPRPLLERHGAGDDSAELRAQGRGGIAAGGLPQGGSRLGRPGVNAGVIGGQCAGVKGSHLDRRLGAVVPVFHGRDPRGERRAPHEAGGGPPLGGPCGKRGRALAA